ncbi:hypothetical protein DSAG12_02871 [Promethearchaeum syntrophicum]|uniref:MULE transposase domain protein n=1 Tax=Promethearchaeum syntrophicum TaxID=2594042 RepID=A0A5B9DCK6_9ARCH|nr:transposase [Candidatus Prometheoarchaeum syntrophicum]
MSSLFFQRFKTSHSLYYIVYSTASSPDYRTHYLCWPESISRACPICKSPIEFAFADNGKKVHTLEGIIHQVVNYYKCSKATCPNSSSYFNPISRFDFGKSYYGKDVLQFIADEVLLLDQTPQQIHKRLKIKYQLKVSLRTVQRIYRDILLIKSNSIDETTRNIISKSKKILLAIDGQDPDKGHDSLWLFTDLLTNRVLRTVLVKTMPHMRIHQEIEEIKQDYGVPIVGVVSDKQNNLVKCMRDKYPDIPHQFCTFHFCQQMWKHLEIFDGNLYGKLKKTLIRADIHIRNNSKPINFEGKGFLPVREVFRGIDSDIEHLTQIKSTKFQFLRGLWLFRNLTRYTVKMEVYTTIMDKQLRIEKIFCKFHAKLKKVLKDTRSQFFETLFLYDSFKLIYQRLYSELSTHADKQQELDNIFGRLWGYVRTLNPDLEMEGLKMIPLQSSHSLESILGEWVRLWNSYLPGLFSYYGFPRDIRTNILQEQAFSQQKAKLVNRLKRKDVSYFIKTRGDLYLRLIHSSESEKSASIVNEYSDHLIQSLRKEFQKRISEETSHWLAKDKEFAGYEEVLQEYHPNWRKLLLKKKLRGT